MSDVNDGARRLIIDYVNYRGERAERTITPTGEIRFESNEWHTTPEWLMIAWDHDKDAERFFALSGIKGVRAATG